MKWNEQWAVIFRWEINLICIPRHYSHFLGLEIQENRAAKQCVFSHNNAFAIWISREIRSFNSISILSPRMCGWVNGRYSDWRWPAQIGSERRVLDIAYALQIEELDLSYNQLKRSPGSDLKQAIISTCLGEIVLITWIDRSWIFSRSTSVGIPSTKFRRGTSSSIDCKWVFFMQISIFLWRLRKITKIRKWNKS